MKLADDVRERTALKRGGKAINVGLTKETGDGSDYEHLFSREPMSDDLVALDDELTRLLSELRDDQLRKIAILRMEGYSHNEISVQMEISTATVTRKLRLIRCTWAAEFDL